MIFQSNLLSIPYQHQPFYSTLTILAIFKVRHLQADDTNNCFFWWVLLLLQSAFCCCSQLQLLKLLQLQGARLSLSFCQLGWLMKQDTLSVRKAGREAVPALHYGVDCLRPSASAMYCTLPHESKVTLIPYLLKTFHYFCSSGLQYIEMWIAGLYLFYKRINLFTKHLTTTLF